MDWVMLGALGEIIGAVAVVLTPWYLASQISHATDASRQEAVREVVDQAIRFTSWVSDSPQKARLWIRGASGDPNLSPEELSVSSVLAATGAHLATHILLGPEREGG